MYFLKELEQGGWTDLCDTNTSDGLHSIYCIHRNCASFYLIITWDVRVHVPSWFTLLQDKNHSNSTYNMNTLYRGSTMPTLYTYITI